MVGDVLDEVCLGLDDVQQGLAGFGGMAEGDEVGGVPGTQALADLRVFLEAADAGAMAAARVDDDDRVLPCVDRSVGGRQDPQQRIVDRVGQVAPVYQDFIGKLQYQRVAGAFVGQGVVAALAQGVPEQQGALAQVGQVFPPLLGTWLLQATGEDGCENLLLSLAQCVENDVQMQPLQLTNMVEQAVER